jgi:hexosaminidase
MILAHLAAVILWTAATAAAAPEVVPQPASVELHDGTWTLHGDLRVAVEDPSLLGVAEWLRGCMEERGAGKIGFVKGPQDAGKNDITLILDPAAKDLLDEGYLLQVAADGVTVRARKPAGVFYGLQTLLQLPSRPAGGGPKSVPCMTVKDMPRFGWRGLMLDCSRTFLTMEYLRRYVDLLAMHKMNVLHLHLTDEQGWRMEIKKHPELTAIGAKWDDKYPDEIDGYYTQEQLRALVKYAAERFVTIVPEIESAPGTFMPGRSLPHCAVHGHDETGGHALRRDVRRQ